MIFGKKMQIVAMCHMLCPEGYIIHTGNERIWL